MSDLLIAKNLQAEPRPATKQEKCSHWMVPQQAWSGGRQHTRCSYCGKYGSIPTKEIKF